MLHLAQRPSTLLQNFAGDLPGALLTHLNYECASQNPLSRERRQSRVFETRNFLLTLARSGALNLKLALCKPMTYVYLSCRNIWSSITEQSQDSKTPNSRVAVATVSSLIRKPTLLFISMALHLHGS